MSWYEIGAIVIATLVIAGGLDRIASLQRQTLDQMRFMARLMEGQAEEMAGLRSDVERIAHYVQSGPKSYLD